MLLDFINLSGFVQKDETSKTEINFFIKKLLFWKWNTKKLDIELIKMTMDHLGFEIIEKNGKLFFTKLKIIKKFKLHMEEISQNIIN